MSVKNQLNPLQRLYRLLQVDKKEITQIYIYALFNGVINLSLPLGIQAILNLIQGAEVSTAWIVMVTIVILGILFTGILQLLQLRLVEDVCQKIFTRASFEFSYRFPRIKYTELYKYYAPELANRFFDTLTIQKGLPKILIDFSLASFQIIVGLFVLSLYHPFFIVFSLVLILVIYTIIAFSGPRGVQTSLKESKHKYAVAHWIEEIARTKLSFKLSADHEISLTKTDSTVNNYLHARESHFRVLVNQFFSLIGFKVLIASGLLITGSLLVFRQEMNIGQFVAAEIIIILIINSVEKLIKSLDSIYDVLTALEKIGHVTDMNLDSDDGFEIDNSVDKIGIELKNVTYQYSDAKEPIIENLNLKIKSGQSTVIYGPPGSGKSTIMGLICNVFDPQQGVIKFNDLALNTINMDSLRRKLGISITTNQIFLGSLYDNITMGNPSIKLQAVQDAIKFTNLFEFVSGLHEGLNTELDPEAKKIPRSVANKIILARAIVNKPKLLLLEDPLDHVPYYEKEEIIKRLTSSESPWSIVVIAMDEIWKKYIPSHIEIRGGSIVNYNK